MKFSPLGNSLLLPKLKSPLLSTRNAVLALLAASLMLLILISNAPPRVSAQARKPFDLVSQFPDVNGFAFNPMWAWQETNPGTPDPNVLCFDSRGEFGGCTTEPVTFDEPNPFKLARNTCRITAGTAVKGHVNWRPVTYETRISWSEFSIDGDYCLELSPLNNHGLTANRNTLHVEFHAGETIRHFNTPWWKEFREKVGIRNVGLEIGKKEKEFVTKFVNGKRAVVIGLLNLDCVHKCYTELHPVYAIAINIKSEAHDDGTVDEVWAIFARNWGNQGWCSQKQHYLNLETNSNRLSLLLPWGPDTPAGSNALLDEVVSDHTKFLSNTSQASGPEVSIGGTQGVMVSFGLPNAKAQARIHGELHLRWRLPKALASQPATAASTAKTMSEYPIAPQEEEVEEKLLYEALGEEGRKRVAAESGADKLDTIPRKVTEKIEAHPRRSLFTILDKITGIQKSIMQPASPAQPPRVESEFDTEKAERDRRLLGVPPDRPQ